MKKIILAIDGMTCSACSNGLEKYINKQEGIINTRVNLVMSNATIEYDEKKLTLQEIEQFVKKAGFTSLGEFKEIKIDSKTKKNKIFLIIYTTLAITLLYISMGHMLNLPILKFLNPNINISNYIITIILITICFLIYGFDIIKNGYKNLIYFTPNMDTLVSIGVLASFLYSLYTSYQILIGSTNDFTNLYFESTSIVIYFVKLGRYIDNRSKDKTKEAIQKLVKITPDKATIKINDKEKVVTLDEIKKEDILISRPGDKIAVDGEITKGEAHLDESFITGESKPVEKKKGNKVIAGSLNYDGYIEYKAEKIGKESTISEIVKLVIEASNTKPKITKITDKVASYFVPVVILIAIITFIIYIIIGQTFEESIITFVTILVVACPCSLGIASPLAVVVSEGLCATNGILIKRSEILENAKNINTIVFDKTGTLTHGKLKINKIINYTNTREKELLELVTSLEIKSNHPIALAFKEYKEENKINPLEVTNIENILGMGIIGNIDNDKIILGNNKILQKYKIKNEHIKDEEILSEKGNTIIYVVKNKEIIALIGLNDIIRKNTKEVIEKLNKNNIETIMLTGDNEKNANIIAKEIGINKVFANISPKDKTKIIKKLKQGNKIVMMCGDGINDSPALANADIGLSISSASDIAINSADVILTRNDLSSILSLINISKRTIKNIKQNLFWAFFYNILMIPLSIGFLKPIGISINPMIASLAMVLSSITVILNTLRIKKQ